MDHLRSQIIDSLFDLLNILTDADRVQALGFPMTVCLVSKRWGLHTDLDEQGAVPALLLVPGRDGRDTEASAVGYRRGIFPVNIVTVLKETATSASLLDQNSDMHYAIERIINGSRDLGLGTEGVLDTSITDFGGTEETLYPFLLTKYRVIVEHEYQATTGV